MSDLLPHLPPAAVVLAHQRLRVEPVRLHRQARDVRDEDEEGGQHLGGEELQAFGQPRMRTVRVLRGDHEVPVAERGDERVVRRGLKSRGLDR